MGETTTVWHYSIECSNEPICEDNICYCRFNRRQSTQIKRFTPYCNDYDNCYGEYNSVRSTCDLVSCRNFVFINSRLYSVCADCATTFYAAVRISGADYFASSQQQSCKCDT